jgi:hypothetical protein
MCARLYVGRGGVVSMRCRSIKQGRFHKIKGQDKEKIEFRVLNNE